MKNSLQDRLALESAIERFAIVQAVAQGHVKILLAFWESRPSVLAAFFRQQPAWRQWRDEVARSGECRKALREVEARAQSLFGQARNLMAVCPVETQGLAADTLAAVGIDLGTSAQGAGRSDQAEVAEDREAAAPGYLKREIESAVKAYRAKMEGGARRGDMDECYREVHSLFPNVSRDRVREVWRTQTGSLRKGRPRKFAE